MTQNFVMVENEAGAMVTIKAATVRQGRMEVRAALQCAAAFHCQVENWHDCDEMKPKPKQKLFKVSNR